MKKANRKRIAVDLKNLPVSYLSHKEGVVLKSKLTNGTFLAGEEPAQVCTKHVSNGSRFLGHDLSSKGE